jgi:thimet oligopeptidase
MIKLALFLLAMISTAGCASAPRASDTDSLEAETQRFMAGYAADLLNQHPDAIATRYSRCGAYVVLPGDSNLQPHDPGPFWVGITDTSSLGDRIEAHVVEAEAFLNQMRAVEGERTAENTLIPHARARARFADAQRLAEIGRDAHPDAAFRAYAQAWSVRLSERVAPFVTDRSFYEALAALDLDRLGSTERYVVERRLRGFHRRGVTLDETTKARMADIRAQIHDVGTRYVRNISTDVRTIRVDPDSLGGLPPDLIAAHASGEPGDDGLVPVAITQANWMPLVTFAESADLRERGAQAYLARGYPQNLPLIDSLRTLRHDLAALLGYDSWADYMLEASMAGSPERVARFLDEVDAASEPAARRTVAALLDLRQQEEQRAAPLSFEHVHYWLNRLKQRDYGFDERAMRPYFSYSAVRDGLLDAFAAMFGLDFRPAPEMPAWSPEAEPYEVYEDGVLVGRLILDMHPREGKYGHCKASRLRGEGRLPEMGILCNLPGGTEGRPGLLSPDQVKLFFHEFGHVVHGLFEERRLLSSGAERDFTEAPSTLFEAWAVDADVLRRFARHYESGEPLPDSLLAAYHRAAAFGRALQTHIGLMHPDLDLRLYSATPEAVPTAEAVRRAKSRLEISLPDFYHPEASTVHLHHYTTNRYTYLWSEVIARDLLTGFDRDDLLDPEAGRRYRDLVLGRIGTAPSAELVEEFLGRPFNADAWRAWLSDGQAQN